MDQWCMAFFVVWSPWRLQPHDLLASPAWQKTWISWRGIKLNGVKLWSWKSQHHTLCLGFALSINGLHLGRNDHHLTFCHTKPIGYWEPEIRYGNGMKWGHGRWVSPGHQNEHDVLTNCCSFTAVCKYTGLKYTVHNNQTIWGWSWQLVSRCFFSDWFVAVQICQMVSLATPLERLQHQSPHRFDAWKRPLHLIIRSFCRCGFGRNAPGHFSFRIRIFACSCSQPTPVFCRSAVDQLSCFTGYSPIAPYASQEQTGNLKGSSAWSRGWWVQL